MADITCLAEGLTAPADFEKTGLNLNEIIVGPTGGGKTFSNAYSRLCHTTESSVVVPISKAAIKKKFAGMFQDRDYKVIDMDFTHPENCTIGYDPLDYVHSDSDVIQLARNLIGLGVSKDRLGDTDPYWNDSATSILAAEIALILLEAKGKGCKASFADVISLHRSLDTNMSSGLAKTNIDGRFFLAGRRYPGNQATELWKTTQNLASKTASCIFSIVNNAVDKIFSEDVLKMISKKNRISFKELGSRKTALFITTSPMNLTLQNLVNVMYADMFRELFETAEKNDSARLDVPVHIICDDFACGSRINNFEDYISIFRAAGISVTILLQSESQLINMYGESAAVTIINNCDTYVYMGGMDIATCRNVSLRMDKPLHRVMAMPLEQVVVFRRGSEPYVARRYQTLNDPVYQQLMAYTNDR